MTANEATAKSKSSIPLSEFSPLLQVSTNSLLSRNPKDNYENILWTTDIKQELPIFLGKDFPANSPPSTVSIEFKKLMKEKGNQRAVNVEREGKWISWTVKQLYDDSWKFGKALIKFGLERYKTVNILAYNSPEWLISFYGGVNACCPPVGIYITNLKDTCMYCAEHSECGCIVVDSLEQFYKYDIEKLPDLKVVVLSFKISKNEIQEIKKKLKTRVEILQWDEFLNIGQESGFDLELEKRAFSQKPGNCVEIIYTSGTTGFPKAVMLSHDNLIFSRDYFFYEHSNFFKEDTLSRLVSFLPLSHIATQFFDIMMFLRGSIEIYFARPDAITAGTLFQTIKYAKPTCFFSVPRIYEKIEENLREKFETASPQMKQTIKWTQEVGLNSFDSFIYNRTLSKDYETANKQFFSKIREELGFNLCNLFIFGAAPLKKTTLDFFKSLVIPLSNAYGMSEVTGPVFLNLSFQNNFDLYSVGKVVAGCEAKILNPDEEKKGEICYRGRNRFLGYMKNRKATMETIDEDGFIHSGDQGLIDDKGNLFITGRIKELIVTAGGENVAPLIIEDKIKALCKIISYIVTIGDQRKYLTALITLKIDSNGNLLPEALAYLQEIDKEVKNIHDCLKSKKVIEYIKSNIDEANKAAVSNVWKIRKWVVLTHEFSIDGGELTPTLKLKRSFVSKKYVKEIESMYSDAKF